MRLKLRNMMGNTTLLYLSMSLAFMPRSLEPGGAGAEMGSRGVAPRGNVSAAPPQHVWNFTLPRCNGKIYIMLGKYLA